MAQIIDLSPERLGDGNTLTRVLDFAILTHVRAVALLVGVCLLAMLPGLFQIPPIDRDEARFAQASKQMLESGDFVDIRFQDTARYKKPVGIHWLQAAAVEAGEAMGVPDGRTRIGLYRLPSLFGAIAAVLLTYWSALVFAGRRGAILAGLMMASSILLGIEARLAKTDAVLLMMTVAAMGAMGRVYLRPRSQPGAARDTAAAAIFWTAVAGGILVKGPLILLFAGLPALALSLADRNARWLLGLRPLPGMAWAAVLVLPWFVAIMLESNGEFFTEAVGTDLLSKVTSGQESHGAPPGIYFLLFWVVFWPGAAIAGAAAVPLWRLRHEPAIRFLLAWVVPSWLLFEAIATKLPHYVLPTFPAIAVLVAIAIERGALLDHRWMRAGTAWWFVFPFLVLLATVFAIPQAGTPIGILSWPLAALATASGLLAWRGYSRTGAENSLLRGIAAALLLAVAVYGVALPAIEALSPSPALARLMRLAPCEDPRLASAGFHEPSLVFVTRTDTLLTNGKGAAEFLRQGGCRIAAVESRQLGNFLQHGEALGIGHDALGRIDALDITHGRMVRISTFRARSEP